LQQKQDESSVVYGEISQFLPIFYAKLRKMKYYGD